jgi:hypothetical protein
MPGARVQRRDGVAVTAREERPVLDRFAAARLALRRRARPWAEQQGRWVRQTAQLRQFLVRRHARIVNADHRRAPPAAPGPGGSGPLASTLSTGGPLARCLFRSFPAAPGPNPPCQLSQRPALRRSSRELLGGHASAIHRAGHPAPFRHSALGIPPDWVMSDHLVCFALLAAFPPSLAGRYSCDYYQTSVGIGLTSRRRSSFVPVVRLERNAGRLPG